MKKFRILLAIVSCLLFNLTTNAETLIKTNDGFVIVFESTIHCKDISELPKNYTCKSNIVIPSGNGILGWRKWIKEQYGKEDAYLKIKRGKIKIIDNQKVLTYKKWLFGKRIVIAILE